MEKSLYAILSGGVSKIGITRTASTELWYRFSTELTMFGWVFVPKSTIKKCVRTKTWLQAR